MTLSSSNTKVGALNHLGLAVVSIEESLKQFQDLFDAPPSAEVLVNEEHGVKALFIEQGQTHIELLEPLRTDSVIGKFIDSHGEGIHHMAFTVADVDAKAEQISSFGVPIIDGPREGLRGRVAFFSPSATHGVLIELIRPPEAE